MFKLQSWAPFLQKEKKTILRLQNKHWDTNLFMIPLASKEGGNVVSFVDMMISLISRLISNLFCVQVKGKSPAASLINRRNNRPSMDGITSMGRKTRPKSANISPARSCNSPTNVPYRQKSVGMTIDYVRLITLTRIKNLRL